MTSNPATSSSSPGSSSKLQTSPDLPAHIQDDLDAYFQEYQGKMKEDPGFKALQLEWYRHCMGTRFTPYVDDTIENIAKCADHVVTKFIEKHPDQKEQKLLLDSMLPEFAKDCRQKQSAWGAFAKLSISSGHPEVFQDALNRCTKKRGWRSLF